MISISNLNKSFGALEVLKDISLEIQQGEIFGLIGRSGEGKSTLLRCINLLIPFDSGTMCVSGRQVERSMSKHDARVYRKGIGMIFQHFSLMERLDVYHNIALPMQCWGYSKEEIDAKVRELVGLVGLEDKIHERPRNLSGGQRQRVAIARALSLNPKILLSDEATSALDPQTTKSILALLREINEKLGITILLVTHEMEVIRAICNRVAVMEQGHIADMGNVEDIFLDQPGSLRRLLGDEPEVVPQQGLTLRLIFRDDGGTSTLIPDLTLETAARFSILSSRLEKFRDDAICTTMLNINQEDREKITRFLDERQIRYEVMEHG